MKTAFASLEMAACDKEKLKTGITSPCALTAERHIVKEVVLYSL